MKKPVYNFHRGVSGGINQHMSKERRARKHARHKANASRRLAVSQNKPVQG